MRNLQRTTRIVASLALCAAIAPAPSAADQAQPRAAGPAIVVEPAVDLVDGQLVTVTASDMPDSQMYLVQCTTSAATMADCDQRGTQLDAPNGHAERRIFVRAVLELADRSVDCRQPEACVLGVVYFDFESEPALVAHAPLHFDPDGPLAPPPTLAANPSGDLTDGQTVNVVGRGFVHADPDGWNLSLVQCVAEPRSETDDCQPNGMPLPTPLDEPGSFSWEMVVPARIYTHSQGTVDCRAPGACVMVAASQFGSPDATAVAPLVFDPDAPLGPPGSVEITPSDALVDGQTVRVEGSSLGFGLMAAQASVYQCAPSPAPERCRQAQTEQSVEDGTLSTEVRVFARISTPDGEVDCRTSPEPCVLVVSVVALDSPWTVAVELRFDADGPLLPDPRITVTPTTGLHDFDTLTVHGTQFSPGARVAVRLCQAGSRVLCDLGERPTADADGGFELDITAWADFTQPGTETPVDCRQEPGCVVDATEEMRQQSAVTPIAFGPPDAPRGRYRDPVFAEDEITADRDVVYRETVDDQGRPVQLMMDIYRPRPDADPATSRPVIVWIHGGGFQGGGRNDMRYLAIEAARRGYVGVSLEYRVGNDDVVQAAVEAYEDASAAVEWLKAHAADWGIDPEAIAAGGWSAGAITATNLAYAPGQIGQPTSNVAAAISLAGAFFDPDDPNVPFPRPLPRPDPGEPPAITFHPTDDTVIPAFGSLDRMCPLVRQAEIPCEYVAYEGVGHLILRTEADYFSRDYVRRGHDFLAEQVLTPHGYFDLSAHAGGPYAVDEGSTVALDGTGSRGDGLSYSWWPAERLSDARSPTPTLAGLDDGTETLTLTVTDEHGVASDDTVDVTTSNVDPTITAAGTVRFLGTLLLTAKVSDPGRADTHEAEIDWGDGRVEPATVVQRQGRATVRGGHHYRRPGRYTITVSVADDDGGHTTRTETVVIGRRDRSGG
jgi:acetyl esterase/lipase